MKLYSYYQSSSAWRVRIALHMKQLPFETIGVNLAAGEQHTDAHRARSPMAKVPVLVLDDGRMLTESFAILEYLEEVHPVPPLLPRDPYLRARARGIAQMVNSGIQPFQNLETRNRVKQLGGDPKAWSAVWITHGLAAVERAVADVAGRFCVGESPTIADIYLVPQLATARRFRVDLDPMPVLRRIETACAELPAFVAAHADRQPDAPVLG
jgi:maleylpyruvate isomerase